MQGLNKDDYLGLTKMELLIDGGVDNWEGYAESTRGWKWSDYNNSTTAHIELLSLLEDGGVDNWEGYDETLGIFRGYSEYVEETDNFVSFEEWLSTL